MLRGLSTIGYRCYHAASLKNPTILKRSIASGILPCLAAIALLILVLMVYWQVSRHAFLDIDDHLYVTENPFVLRGMTLEGISWAFTTFHAGNWHPLTWLSHMLDVELFGLSAGWHHRMNVLYHLLNTELLFLVLWRMTGGVWQSVFVAALFGLHPLHVESVAWIAERKDVLSTLFWILTMGAYLRFVRRPCIGRYLHLTAAFALGLMCKAMLVTLPLVLLLMDWWPLGRMVGSGSPLLSSGRLSGHVFSRLVGEKVPLLAMSAISCVITYLAQSRGEAVPPLDYLPVGSRISNAFLSYVNYLGKTVWPSSLAVYYPHPAFVHAEVSVWGIGGAILLLCGLSVVALQQGRRRPFIIVGWLWYLGTLVPVIGVVQVGGQAMADRYTYVPLIGIFIAVAWGIQAMLSGWGFRRFAIGMLGGVLMVLSVTAWGQVGYWRDTVTLLSRTVAVTDRNWFGLSNLGLSYAKLGQYQQATGWYRKALQIVPDDAETWNNLGVSYSNLRQHQQAIDSFREALRIQPDYAVAWNNLGVSYSKIGQRGQAVDSFREALRVQPDYAVALNNLVAVAGDLGQSR